MKTTYLILFLFFVPIAASSQILEFHGCVKSKTDSASLSFANIYIYNTGIGTVTNEQGEFIFKIPIENKEDTIEISCIGYATTKIKITDNLNINTFYLEEKTYELSQAIILADTLGTDEIMKNVFKNFRKNYPRRQFMLDIFHRSVSSTPNNEYTSLFEAAHEIQDFGFDSKDARQRIRLLEVRKSEAYYKKSFGRSIFTKFMGEKNELYDIFSKDLIRNNDIKISPLNKQNKTNYIYELINLTYLDSTLIYVISYRPSTKDRVMDIEGTFYVHGDNYAIIKAEFNAFFNAGGSSAFIDNKYITKTEVRYIEYENKYFLNMLIHQSPVKQNNAALSYYDENDNLIPQRSVTHLYTNNIYYTSRDFKRIKLKQMESKGEEAYDKEYPYHEEFWKNYNTVLINPLLKKAKSDLEREKELEQQFKDNSKKQ